MEKLTFHKKRRFRVVAISDCPVPTYRLELVLSFENDSDEMSWVNDLLIYNWDFSKVLRMLCIYLGIEVIQYDFFEDERKWIYLEN